MRLEDLHCDGVDRCVCGVLLERIYHGWWGRNSYALCPVCADLVGFPRMVGDKLPNLLLFAGFFCLSIVPHGKLSNAKTVLDFTLLLINGETEG